MSSFDSMFDVKPAVPQSGAAAFQPRGPRSRIVRLERKPHSAHVVRLRAIAPAVRVFQPAHYPAAEHAPERIEIIPQETADELDAPQEPKFNEYTNVLDTADEMGVEPEMTFYTISPLGLEGHSFLPSREELMRELIAIEEQDQEIETAYARREEAATERLWRELVDRELKEEERRRAEEKLAMIKPRPVFRIREHLIEELNSGSLPEYAPEPALAVNMPSRAAIAEPQQSPQRQYRRTVEPERIVLKKKPEARPQLRREIPRNDRIENSPANGPSRQALQTAVIKRRAFRMPRITMPVIPKLSRTVFRGGMAALALALVFGGGAFGKQFIAGTQKQLYADGRKAYEAMLGGIDAALEQNFPLAEDRFGLAHDLLQGIGGKARLAGKGLAAIADTLSFSSETISGVHVLDAAEHFARAGQDMAAYAALFSKNGVGSITPKELITGYLSHDDLKEAKSLLSAAIGHLDAAEEELLLVETDKLPDEFSASVKSLQEKVPKALAAAKEFSANQDAIFRALGYLGPRKYLVIFQNNAELRPTGGFIGSYALLDILDGKITRLFIDDVFNIDGQLIEKVIPPSPIQKISTAWSLHDSNWFFDFPTSAKKIAWFYEKTGGATVDGVIAITPAVLEGFLELTGPLTIPNYNLTFTKENFRDELSYMVEEGLPKKEGESSKIVLRDIGTMLFEKLGASWKENGAGAFITVLQNALTKRDLTAWIREAAIEDFLMDQGWGGMVRISDGDYLAIVHTNINGYKTDRVISDEISHQATIAEDGSVVDTVTITRTHNGSPSTRYNSLYQKVNADYLRVYVPKGSHLIEAEGYTPEKIEPPIDYAEHNFKGDRDVEEIEGTLREHFPSNTQIFDEAGKTVFGNWVYVSPGEKVTVRYTYKLPWKIVTDTEAGTYRMLVQKQAGLERATFNASVNVKGGKLTTGDTPPQNAAFEKDIEYAVEIK